MKLRRIVKLAAILCTLSIVTVIPYQIANAAYVKNYIITTTTYTGTVANDGTLHVHDYDMVVDPGGDSVTAISMPQGAGNLWAYSEPSQATVSFGTATWEIGTHGKNTGTNSGNLTAKLYKVYSDGSLYAIGEYSSGSIFPDETLDTDSVITPIENVTFNAGERIGVRWSWSGESFDLYGNVLPEVIANSNSGVHVPSSDPVYPAPELASIVLMSLGLVAILGFMYYRYRRTNKNPVNV